METQYTDVKFNFHNTEEEDAWALGTAIVRAEGEEMVLELAEDDDQPPFCRLIGKRVGEHSFAGDNSIRRRDLSPISAEWTMDGALARGTWSEGGQKYPFTFALPG